MTTKVWLVWCAMAAFAVLVGCQLPLVGDALADESGAGQSRGSDVPFGVVSSQPGTVKGHYYDKGAIDLSLAQTDYNSAFSDKRDNDSLVQVSAWIVVHLSADPDPATLNSSTISLTRAVPTVSGAPTPYPSTVPFDTEYRPATKTLVIKPRIQFYGKKGASGDSGDWGQLWWDSTGLKPAMTYTVTLGAGIKDTAGRGLATAAGITSWSFTTARLDYGLYFFGSDGLCQKYVPGRANPYFDPAKKTMVYVHGLQKNRVNKDYNRQSFLFWDDQFNRNGVTAPVDAAKPWLADGWNLGIMYWEQFSDDEEGWYGEGAEAKIWSTTDRKAMRYRCFDGKSTAYAANPGFNRPVPDLLFAIYRSALGGATVGEIRLVGHSMGSQIAMVMAKLASDAAQADPSLARLVPARIGQLDVWSNNNTYKASYQSRLAGKYPGEVVTAYASTLMARHPGLVIEQYKTTPMFGSGAGNDNDPLKKLSAYAFVKLDWIQYAANGIMDKWWWRHEGAKYWYFMSYANGSKPYPCAGTANASIGVMMNRNAAQTYGYFQNGGTTSPSASDDSFAMASLQSLVSANQ